MPWQTLSLHFKQTYEAGYRYFDKCGEFMVAAEDKFHFIAIDAKPTGAKMEIPEQGVNLTCDTTSLVLSQELPVGDNKQFVSLCNEVAHLALSCFKPRCVAKNGFCIKDYWAFQDLQEILTTTLKIGDSFQNELTKTIGMVPSHKKLDYTFSSGSKELHLLIQPVTFEKTYLQKQNAGHQITPIERNRIDRRNQFAERINKTFVVSHALMLELDLMESEPPADASLEKHFTELSQKSDQLKKMFTLK